VEFMDVETLSSIRLAPGDYIKFKRAQSLFKEAKDVMPALEEPVKESVGSKPPPGFYTIQQVARFLAGKEDIVGDSVDSSGKLFGGKKLPVPSDEEEKSDTYVPPKVHGAVAVIPAKDTAREAVYLGRSLMQDILCLDDCVTNEKGEKPLLPVNFVATPRGIVLDQEQVVITDKDGNLKIKPSKNRPTPDKLSIGQ
jgi:hypothetical protein